MNKRRHCSSAGAGYTPLGTGNSPLRRKPGRQKAPWPEGYSNGALTVFSILLLPFLQPPSRINLPPEHGSPPPAYPHTPPVRGRDRGLAQACGWRRKAAAVLSPPCAPTYPLTHALTRQTSSGLQMREKPLLPSRCSQWGSIQQEQQQPSVWCLGGQVGA